LLVRLALAWAALGLACLLLYARVLGQVSAYAATIYRTAAVGYAPFSSELFGELWRGLSAGFGGATIAGALLALSIGGFGFLLFLRRNSVFAIVLIAPLAATAGFLLARDLRFSPRFFLWALPAACIFAPAAASSLEDRLASRGLAAGRRAGAAAHALPVLAVAALALTSVLSLPAYYRIPKQPNRESLDRVLALRRADDPIVAAYLARWGMRFYGPRKGLTEGRSFFSVTSTAKLEEIEAATGRRTVWLLTTFPRALRLEYPDLDRYIRDHYRKIETFPATIGDGEITIWIRELRR